ncbi:MAG: succinate dehydrogenase [Desulfotomaculum sp.]|nr:succinate dehydrogenase [Desulfotomaculum sp.]
MQFQRIVTGKIKSDLYYDLIELFSGLFLAGFLGMHLIFESSIIAGKKVFNNLSQTLDENYLALAGISLVVVVFFIHFLTAGRRIPTRCKEQKIIWHHTGRLRHLNTWAWVLQIITGIIILILGSIHMWVVVTDRPIKAETSALRIQSGYLWFYVILLLLSVVHAGIGIYRQFIKWGWFPRKPLGYVIGFISIFFILLGFTALFTFLRAGGL